MPSPDIQTPDQSLSSAWLAEAAQAAADRIAPLGAPSPLEQVTGFEGVWVKAEYDHPTGSFKWRGAGNAVTLAREQGYDSVVAASTGSHGNGVVHAAMALGVKPHVFMPGYASEAKKNLIRASGAELHELDMPLEETIATAQAYSQATGAKFVHPYADKNVIAGQATAGLELADDLTHVVLPVGGGGLISGIASVLKHRKTTKDVKVIAAQVEGCDTYARSLASGQPERLKQIRPAFEGVAVRQADPRILALLRELVDDVVVVDGDEVHEANFDYYQATGILLEPAGGIAPATARKLSRQLGTGARVLAMATGARPPQRYLQTVANVKRNNDWRRSFLARKIRAVYNTD